MRVHTSAATHPKLLAAGFEASWLWVLGLCYCHTHKTDGFLPVAGVSSAGPRRVVRRSSARLVAVGLWEPVEGGWRVHNYQLYQQSKDEILDKQAKIHDSRVAAGRKGGQATQANLRVVCSTKPSNAVSPKSTIEQEQEQKEKKNEHSDEKPVGHRKHAWCGQRFCVPQFMHDQFEGQLGEHVKQVDLVAWYERLDAKAGGPIPDVLIFLRSEFKSAIERRFGGGKQQSSYVPQERASVYETCSHEPRCTSAWRCQQKTDIENFKQQGGGNDSDDLSVGGPFESPAAGAAGSDEGGHHHAGEKRRA